MKHLEDFIAKDKLEVSDKMFERICAGIEKEKQSQMPAFLTKGVQICFILTAALLMVNILTGREEDNLQAGLQKENEEFKAFAKENYFDILSDYYPQFLVEKEE